MDTFVRTNEGTPSYLLRTKVRTKVYIDYIYVTNEMMNFEYEGIL